MRVFGAPRPMKMGTTRSPCRYDAAARYALQSAKSATACDLTLRLEGGHRANIAKWSAHPLMEAVPINPGTDVMCRVEV
jgi:hypothetical protein